MRLNALLLSVQIIILGGVSAGVALAPEATFGWLHFGPEARLRVLVRLHGPAVSLTEYAGDKPTGRVERFKSQDACKDVTFRDPDGKTSYVITHLNAFQPKKDSPLDLMVNVDIQGAVTYRQYCDIVATATNSEKAPMAHFHGPLTIEPRKIYWKLPESVTLLRRSCDMARYIVLGFCCAALASATITSAQTIEPQADTPQFTFDQTVGNDRTHIETFSRLAGKSHNPDAKEQKRLRIRWDKTSMGFFDYSSQRQWHDSDAVHPRRQLAVRGTLSIVAEDGKIAKPIDWAQGVQVVLSRTSRNKPDWTKRHDSKDSAWSDCVVQKDGTFRATFRLDDIRRPVARTEPFQVAISLAVRSGRSLTWRNSVPVLPQTVAMVPIAGPHALSPTMQAINGAPSVSAEGFDPVTLVRAVNHLHSLGKAKAITELRDFLRIARYSNGERDPANIDTSDGQCVFLIVRLLFEPEKRGDKLPDVGIGAFIPFREENDVALWPLFPLALQDDIPFVLNEGVILGGLAEHPGSHVNWAEKHGKLRARPLWPADDPLRAVDKLAALPQTARLGLPDRGVLRRQGWKTIAHLAQRPAGSQDFWPDHRGKYDANADWEAHKRIAAKLKIRWDEKLQRYVAP